MSGRCYKDQKVSKKTRTWKFDAHFSVLELFLLNGPKIYFVYSDMGNFCLVFFFPAFLFFAYKIWLILKLLQ